MQAICNWAFIKRNEQLATHMGLEISEKALTKNYEGVLKSTGNDKFVTNGDAVLVPHYGVTDYLVDGVEYAVAKVSDLFAMKEGDSYRPINNYVKVRKCVNDHIRGEDEEIVLHMTDGFIENTTWTEIIDVADDCKHLTKSDIGMFCVAPESSDLLQRILYTKDYCLHESAIEFVTTGD